LMFLKAWIVWVQTFPPESDFMFAEAARMNLLSVNRRRRTLMRR